MAVVAKGLLNGEDLMKFYGGTRKKKSVLVLAPRYLLVGTIFLRKSSVLFIYV